MNFSNIVGTLSDIFSLGRGMKRVTVGAISKPGILQGRDADARTVRDLTQFNPRYVVASGCNQLATEYEVHDLSAAGFMLLEAGASYEQDQGAILIM